MRVPAFSIWAAALVLAPCTCHATPDDRGSVEPPAGAMRLPRIRIVVEVDVLGADAPSALAGIPRHPSPRPR